MVAGGVAAGHGDAAIYEAVDELQLEVFGQPVGLAVLDVAVMAVALDYAGGAGAYRPEVRGGFQEAPFAARLEVDRLLTVF